MTDWGRSHSSIAYCPREETDTGRSLFPETLWNLLLHPAGKHLAYWVSPTHFVLVKGCALESYLLLFFASGRMASFTRQLNYWGFSCVHNMWSHPHFQLPDREQGLAIKRKKNTWRRAQRDMWEESKRRVEIWNDPGILAAIELDFAQGRTTSCHHSSSHGLVLSACFNLAAQ